MSFPCSSVGADTGCDQPIGDHMTESTAATADLHAQNTFAARATAHRMTVGATKPTSAVRTFDIAALERDGTLKTSQVRTPVLPLFDNAFSAFAHGTVIQAEHAPIAVEDIQPGDKLRTLQGDNAEVLWIGSSTIAPNETGRETPLMRVMPDSFGMGRPSAFVTFGPAARLLQTPHHLRATQTDTPMLSHMSEFADGTNVIEVSPPAPIRLFHVCLDRHAVINAGGLAMESFHPDLALAQNLPQSVCDLFLSMFPRIDALTDFGPLAYTRTPDRHDRKSAA